MSEQREALAEVLGTHEQVVGGCSCGWRVARRSVEAWRSHTADALLASPALARLLADAEQRGADRVAAAVEAVCDEVSDATRGSLDEAQSFGGALVGAVNIYSDGFDRICALLTTGAADRVRADDTPWIDYPREIR